MKVNVSRSNRITLVFIFKSIFLRNKSDFLGQIDWFHLTFFCKSGQGGLKITDSISLGSIIDSLLKYKHFLFNGS